MKPVTATTAIEMPAAVENRRTARPFSSLGRAADAEEERGEPADPDADGEDVGPLGGDLEDRERAAGRVAVEDVDEHGAAAAPAATKARAVRERAGVAARTAARTATPVMTITTMRSMAAMPIELDEDRRRGRRPRRTIGRR